MRDGMSASMTVRLSGQVLRELRVRAKALGTTPSEVVRSVLARELGTGAREASALELTEQWVGSVRDPVIAPGRDARRSLDEWRPDRRD